MHDHLLSVGVTIGPLILRVLVLAAIPVVAGYALLRGFLAEPGQRARAWVVGTAAGAVAFELLLSGGLALPEQLVPVLLAGLAVPLYLVLSTDPRFARLVGAGKAIAPVVIAGCGAVAVWLLCRGWFAGRSAGATGTLLHTGVVLALVALAWFVAAPPRLSVRVLGAVLASALVLATGQAVVLRPAQPAPGVAVVAEVDSGAAPVRVVVTPNRPGRNLVHVQADGAAVGASPKELAPARSVAGADGGWATVLLTEGATRLWVRHGGVLTSVEVRTGTRRANVAGLAGPDAPECASALIGEALAHAPQQLTRCPAQELTSADADTLRAIAAGLGGQVRLVGDGSPRSAAAEAAVRTVTTVTTDPAAPVLVVAGPAAAATAPRTAYLAPWLEPATDARYRAALATNFPGERPTVAGQRAWRAALGEQESNVEVAAAP